MQKREIPCTKTKEESGGFPERVCMMRRMTAKNCAPEIESLFGEMMRRMVSMSEEGISEYLPRSQALASRVATVSRSYWESSIRLWL